MITLLSKIFIKNGGNVSDPAVRTAYGTLCGLTGIFLNFLLFAGKLAAGLAASSISIMADAFNNLSDAGSSVITLLGFRMAGQRPDPEHPFGHGRLEYVSGLVVSLIIVVMGFELGKGSIEKIIDPTPVEYTAFAFAALAVSIFVKFYMFLYNRSVGRKIDSAAMRATALDSLSDTVSTAVVLLCAIISRTASVQIDGWAGVVVALFICITGVKSAKDTIDLILGAPPEKDFVSGIEKLVMAHPEVIGVHDLIVHNYGPGRTMVSLHAEVPASDDIMYAHDAIDNIEREITDTFGCMATIHMDPVDSHNEKVAEMHQQVARLMADIDPAITMHDFRMVSGPTHTNLIFDIVVPFSYKISDEGLKKRIAAQVAALPGNYFAVVNVDKAYV